MGTSIGAIKQLGEEGKLTSDVLFRALTDRKFTDGIDAEFRELPVTFDEAMTSVSNAAIITFGAFDRGGQFSTALANFVTDGAGGFRDLESSAEAFGREVRASIEGATEAFGPLISEIQRLLGIMNGAGWGDLFSMERELKDVDRMTGWLSQQGLGGALLTGNSVGDWWNGTARGTSLARDYVRGRDAASDRLQRQQGEQWVRDQQRGRDVMGNPIAPAPRATPTTSSSGHRRRSSGPSAETLAARAERDRLAAIRDEADQAREKARLEDDIIAARAAMATAARDVYAFEMQMIHREQSAREADIATRVKLGELSAAQANEQRGLVSELAEARKTRALRNSEEAEAALREREMRDDADTLRALSQATTNRRERLELEERILSAQHAIEKARLEEAIAADQVADATKARANLEVRQEADRVSLARDSAGPLDRYIEGLRQSRENIGDEIETLVVDELQQVRDGIRGALQKQLGIDDPLISGLLNMLIDQVIMKPIAEALSKANGGSGGGLIGSVAGFFGSLFGRASGGYVAPGQMVRVNEASSPGRVEAFMSRDGGTIVPLGQMNAMASAGQQGASGSATVRLELSGDIDARIQQVSGPVAVEIVKASAPAIVRSATENTMRQAGRPRI